MARRITLILFSILLSSLLVDPVILGNGAATSARANTLPVPVVEVGAEAVLTLENVTIDATNSYDPDGVVTFYKFQFDDTTETDWIKTPTVVHVYKKERFYNIRLKVMDDAGEESNYWATVTVEVVDRLPHIVIKPEMKVKPHAEVTLEGYRCWDRDGHIINYTWEFEDNTTLYGPNVTHSFADPGIYNIFLTVLDDDRKSNKSSMRVIVSEPALSRQRTMLGVLTIIAIAATGASVIWFGRRSPASRRLAGTGTGGGPAGGLTRIEGARVRAELNGWYSRFGDGLPEKYGHGLPEYAEEYIHALALSELAPEERKALSSAFEEALAGQRLTPNAAASLSQAVEDIIPAAEQRRTDALTASYKFALKTIKSHEDLGAARYYVPRTNEQEILAAFLTRKLWKRKIADEKTFDNSFTDADKEFIKSVTNILGRSWKAAHSFKTRSLPPEAKLILGLLLCEKAGKRRYGGAKVRLFDAAQDDEELDLIEELIVMFNEIWQVLQFEEFKDKSMESKILSAVYTYEKLGAVRYLNNNIKKDAGAG